MLAAAQEDSDEQRVAQLTKWKEMSPLEFYSTVRNQDAGAKWHEINKCSICQCELYDDIMINEDEEDLQKMHDETIKNLLKAEKILEIDAEMKEAGLNLGTQSYGAMALYKCCGTHLFHKDCLIG